MIRRAAMPRRHPWGGIVEFREILKFNAIAMMVMSIFFLSIRLRYLAVPYDHEKIAIRIDLQRKRLGQLPQGFIRMI